MAKLQELQAKYRLSSGKPLPLGVLPSEGRTDK